MFTRIIALARNILQSREGAVAIHMGLIIASLIGMGALASEIGFVTYKHRQMQSAADAAAFGAAVALSNSPSANFTLQAKALTAAVGFVDGTGGVTVTVNKPPASGPNAGVATAVEVIITQPWTLSVVGAVNSLTGSANPTGLFTLGVQAVATTGTANICMLALATTGAAFQLNGSVTVGNSNCGIADNSASNPSTNIKGGSATIRG
jgi:Flp pilus assembly protein TadG